MRRQRLHILLLSPQVYQELCKKHTTFRERSENTDLAVRGSPSSDTLLNDTSANLRYEWHHQRRWHVNP